MIEVMFNLRTFTQVLVTVLKCFNVFFCILKCLETIWMQNVNHKSKNGGKDQESIQSSTTPDPGYHIKK